MRPLNARRNGPIIEAMIAFGSVVDSEETFERCASPGLDRVREPDSVLAHYTDAASIGSAYNEILDAVREREDLEALVLVREDAEIRDPDLCARLRARLEDDDVALVVADDGLVALSPWAVRHLRFDEPGDHGALREQARAAGRKVVDDDLGVVRHAEPAERPAAAGVRGADGPQDQYFEWPRPDIMALVPLEARRVLDVGCGAGALAMAIKERQGAEVSGIELFPDAAAIARTRLDRFLQADLDSLEDVPFPEAHFDVAIFGDVLEHLRDPLRLLRTLRPHLAPDAHVVCSIPNIKHWSVLLPLLVNDRFTYEDAGLLDRTHVHFFTLAEARDLLAQAGLRLERVSSNHVPMPPEGEPLVTAAAALGADPAQTRTRLEAYQYLVVARPAS